MKSLSQSEPIKLLINPGPHVWIRQLISHLVREAILIVQKNPAWNPHWDTVTYKSTPSILEVPKALVFDEFELVQNWNTKRCQAVKELCWKFDNVTQIALTKTPWTEPDKLWAQLTCLFPKHFGKRKPFLEKYCLPTYNRYGIEGWELNPDKSGELKAELDKIGLWIEASQDVEDEKYWSERIQQVANAEVALWKEF